MPAISVILPTYNRSQTLARAIQSVLHQTFADFELIVVDDASTDDTPALMKTINDPRLRYLQLEKNRGAAGARNAGIAQARAQWVAFQDSDDEWIPTKLAQQFAVARDAPAEVGLVLAGYFAQVGQRRVHVQPQSTLSGGNPIIDLLDGWPIITPTWLVRRGLLQELNGFDESWPCFEDWDLVFRIAGRCRVLAVSGPVLVKYGSGAQSVCADLQTLCSSLERIITQYAVHWAREPRRLARRLTHLGCMRFALGQRRAARVLLASAIRKNPWTPATHGLFWASLGGPRALRVAQRLWPRHAAMAP